MYQPLVPRIPAEKWVRSYKNIRWPGTEKEAEAKSLSIISAKEKTDANPKAAHWSRKKQSYSARLRETSRPRHGQLLRQRFQASCENYNICMLIWH